MQDLAWLGFAFGIGLLLLTGSSVIKTLLIPRNRWIPWGDGYSGAYARLMTCART
jgi:hypothetical protein